MPLYILFGVITILILLISYGFISHTLRQRRIQRQRLITALKTRERNFKYMVTGFPPGFLPHELSALAYRALIHTCEELARLEPDNGTHKTDAALYSAELNSQKQNTLSERVKLESMEQIGEVRQHLQELHRFVLNQETTRQINPIQTAALNDQIKRLSLQITIDGFALQARQAQQRGKPRLAIHHLNLAKKALDAENGSHQYDKHIQKIVQRIQALEQQDKPAASTTSDTSNTTNKEWENFEEEENWKKKQIYD